MGRAIVRETRGFIVDCDALANNYRVQVEGAPGPIEATYTPVGGSSPGFSRNAITLSRGDFVIVQLPVDEDGNVQPGETALITSAYPMEYVPADGDGEVDLAPGTTTRQLHPKTETTIRDWSADSHDGGGNYQGTEDEALSEQWGYCSAMGVALKAGIMHAALRAGEQAGVEAHVLDHLLQVFGFNLHIITGGGVRKCISDGGEYNDIEVLSSYLWEMKQGAGSEGDVGDKPPRVMKLRGYAGDCDLEIIQAPPPESGQAPDGSGTVQAADGMRLLTEQKTWDGDWYIEGAGEMAISKVGPAEPVRLGDFLCNEQIRDEFEDPDTGEQLSGHSAGIDNPSEELLGDNTIDPDTGVASPVFDPTIPEDQIRPREVTSRVFIKDVDDSGDGQEYAGDRTVTVDGEDLVGNPSSFLAREQGQKRREERLKSLFNSRMVSIGDDPSVTEQKLIDVVGLDHRGEVRLFDPGELESFLKMTHDGTFVMQAGDQKMVMGRDITEVYGDTFVIGDDIVGVMAGSVDIVGLDGATIYSKGDILIQPGSATVIKDMVRGQWQPNRTSFDPDARVLKWNGTDWGVIAEVDNVSSPFTTAFNYLHVEHCDTETARYLDLTGGTITTAEMYVKVQIGEFDGSGPDGYIEDFPDDPIDLPENVGTGTVITIDGARECYRVVGMVEELPPGFSAESSAELDITITSETCDQCLGIDGCWELTPCGDDGDVLYVRNIIDSQGNDVSLADGMVVQIDGICYSASSYTGDLECVEDVTATNGVRWKLTNCEDASDVIYAFRLVDGEGEEVDSESGDIVRIEEQCYTVSAPSRNEGCDACESGVGDVTVEQAAEWKLVPCDEGEETIYVSSAQDEDGESEDISSYAVVRLSNQLCYNVQDITDPCAACAAGGEAAVTVLEAYDNCDACVYYELEHCDTGATIYTYVDLAGLGYSVGNVISLDSGDCYEIKSTTDDLGEETSQDITVEDSWPSCPECRTVTLVNDCMPADCGPDSGAEDLIVHDDDTLVANIGGIAQVEDVCYTITKGGTEPEDGYDTPSYTIFAQCQDCLDDLNSKVRKQMILTDIRIEGTSIIVERVTQLVKDNKIIGYCEEEDIVLPGTDCEPDAT